MNEWSERQLRQDKNHWETREKLRLRPLIGQNFFSSKKIYMPFHDLCM